MKRIELMFVALAFCLPMLAQKAGYEPPKNMPRNIIIIMANGLGINQITASTLKNGVEPPFTKFPVIGFTEPWQPNGKMPSDSTTAWAIGTNKMNVMADKTIEYQNIFDLAKEQKMKTAFITTGSLTGPTAKILVLDKPKKKDKEALAAEYLKTDLDIIIGGGSRYFDERKDKKNLWRAFKKEGFNVEHNTRKMGDIMGKKTIAIVAKEDIPRASNRKDFLTKAATSAIRSLTTLDGYLLVINDTKIEEADTLNNISLLTERVGDLNKLIESINNEAGGETLILLLANYEAGGLNLKNATMSKKIWPAVAWQSKSPTPALAPLFAKGPSANQFSGVSSLEDIFTKLSGMLNATRR